MAEFLNLDCIGFGTILESAYGIGHSEGRDYIRGSHFKFWGGLFDAAGLPFILPVAGISEVGTSIIVKNSPFGEYSQSCMRGEWKKPCLNCWKCFRKRILDWAIDGEKPSSEIILKLFNNKEALRFLSSIPIKHENVLTWATNRLEINNELFNLLKKRVMGDDNSLDYLDKWYSPSIEIIPKKYRKFVENKICCYLRVMDINDENEIRNWSLSAIIDQPETNSASEKLSNRMDIHIKSH
jgi:hypothetical protein